MPRCRGENAPNACLTRAQVEAARRRFIFGEAIAALATQYRVSYKTMWRVVRHQTYRDVDRYEEGN